MKLSIITCICIASSTCVYPAQRAKSHEPESTTVQQSQPVVYAPFGVPYTEPQPQQSTNDSESNKNDIIVSALSVVNNAATMLINHDNKPAVKEEAGKMLDNIVSFVSTILKRNNETDDEIKELATELLLTCARVKKAFEITGHRR